MTRTSLSVISVLATLMTGDGLVAQGKTVVDVYKDPTCGCCINWVTHLRRQGFATKTTDVDNLDDVKAKHGVPPQARACHTALVGGYVIEGHVPATEIQRLLTQRPVGIVGLAVPGMPVGSPGMEGSNPRSYDVLAFDKQGRTTVFSTERP